MSVTSLKPHQLAPRQRQEQIERQMKQNFEQKIKIDEDEQAAASGMIVKTDQGIEFVKSTKQRQAEESNE